MYISKDRYKFLLYVLFGSERNPITASSKVAYRDMCRTLRFGADGGVTHRKYVDALLEDRIKNILTCDSVTQSMYDTWHHSVCDEIVKYYTSNKIVFTIGQAQKWLNMIMKYLYIRGYDDINTVLPLLHVPLDQYIIQSADRELSIKRPCLAWSKLDNYDIYLDYQKAIRESVNEAPLLWEIEAWLREQQSKSDRSYGLPLIH